MLMLLTVKAVGYIDGPSCTQAILFQLQFESVCTKQMKPYIVGVTGAFNRKHSLAVTCLRGPPCVICMC